MANMNRDDGNTNQASTGGTPTTQRAGGQQQQGLGSPISNDAYNVIAALHKKLQALEVYRTFSKDGPAIWQQLSQHDTQSVELLCDELERMVKEGKLRATQGTSRSTHKA